MDCLAISLDLAIFFGGGGSDDPHDPPPPSYGPDWPWQDLANFQPHASRYAIMLVISCEYFILRMIINIRVRLNQCSNESDSPVWGDAIKWFEQDVYILFYPSDRYLWMKVAGEISRSRPLSALSAILSPAPLPWFVYSNLLQNFSRPFINQTHLTWHSYFMHVVPVVVSYALSSTCLARACHGWNSTQNTYTENIIMYKLTNYGVETG